ncbi:MAG TPA: hypothetical protein VMT20_00235 [Terriglobia bacterium]|nr:hypothetical protein [Terriglobia bacterium]
MTSSQSSEPAFFSPKISKVGDPPPPVKACFIVAVSHWRSLLVFAIDKVYAAANQVLANEKAASWNLKAFKYYYIPVPPNGIAGIVVEPAEELLRLQQELLDAVAPFTEKTGTAAAFVSADGGLDIQQGLIDYVTNFKTVAAGVILHGIGTPLRG